MKVLIAWITVLFLFSGCGAAETYEYVTDGAEQPVLAQPKQIHFFLAEETVMPVMESEEGKLYLCGDYEVMSQVMESGDLERTVRQVCGYSPEELTIIQTAAGDIDCHEFVWTSASDGGQQIGRATVLDDGNYHYVLSATVRADKIEEYQEIWNGIFETFELI